MANVTVKQEDNIEIETIAPKNRSLIVEFLLGGVSTSCACLFSNPFEGNSF